MYLPNRQVLHRDILHDTYHSTNLHPFPDQVYMCFHLEVRRLQFPVHTLQIVHEKNTKKSIESQSLLRGLHTLF